VGFRSKTSEELSGGTDDVAKRRVHKGRKMTSEALERYLETVPKHPTLEILQESKITAKKK